MNTILKIVFVFLAITGATTVMINVFNIELAYKSFWSEHGFFFLIFISIFPRLTLLFSSVPSGGLFWWLGFFFAPRFLVAILATLSYWNNNPILVMAAWLIALGGESGEKYMFSRNIKVVWPRGQRHRTKSSESYSEEYSKTTVSNGDVFEAEYHEIKKN